MRLKLQCRTVGSNAAGSGSAFALPFNRVPRESKAAQVSKVAVRQDLFRRLPTCGPFDCPGTPDDTAQRGFTLVELLVVIAILGIIMTVGIPSLQRRFNPNSIEQAVKDIMEACSHARAYAILQSTPVDLVFDGDSGSLSLQPAGGARTAPKETDALAPMEPEPVFEDSTPRSSSIVSGETLNFSARLSESIGIEAIEVNFEEQSEYTEARVRFYPNGTCDECKIVLVHIENGARRLITLEVTTAIADVESDISKFR